MRKSVTYIAVAIIAVVALLSATEPAMAQRRVTPVNNAATATQPVNEFSNDSVRIRQRMRESMAHYHDEQGNIVYIDTVTGREWRDSTEMFKRQPMKYPLWQSAAVSVDMWNPLMRLFGQSYGLIDVAAQVSLHNRYIPVFETGLGIASNTPAANNFTYKSPLSVYFRLGADYNFLFNSTPDYQFVAGVRYGLSPFAWSVKDITIQPPYWDDPAHPDIPSQHSLVGWFELTMGLRVNISGPFSAGWTLRYHTILHESKGKYGQPWYIPGYGSRSMPISGSISFFYTFDINKDQPKPQMPTTPQMLIPTPETDDPYQPGINTNTSEREQDTPLLK